jgi:hypothetical protein
MDQWRALVNTVIVNELSISTEGGEILDRMTDYQLLKKYSPQWN